MKLHLYFILPYILQATLWRVIMRSFFYFFSNFEVRGLENLKNLRAPLIFAPNHASEFDSVLLPLALPLWSKFEPMFFVLKEFKYYTDPAFGLRRHLYNPLIFKILGAYPIQPGKRDYSRSLATHVSILKHGGSICIFPEGGISKTGELGQSHGGVGYLTLETGRSVVPVYITGTHTLTLKQLLLRRARIVITFLPALASTVHAQVTTNTGNEYQQAAETIVESIRRAQIKAQGGRVAPAGLEA